MRVAVWIGLAFDFLLYSSGIAVATYYETPRAGETWEDTLDGRSLIPLSWWQAQSALSTVLDLYIFILPLPIIAKLALPPRRQIPVVAVFSLALMGIGASIASLVERIEITHSNDTTWISSILFLCSVTELNVAIIVSSAPAFFSFSRSHLVNLPSVKLLLSNFSFSRKTESYESYHLEVTAGGQGYSYNNGASVRLDTTGVGDKVVQGQSHRYHELGDTWTPGRGAS
ncbi:hypothetical protein GGS23DRAFT_544657 [Durotheca rogersii]|uniref:uncharacterized protein n=1 Tax=Durotheca rogersii TaxID=419775 RepID=UPI00222008A2|nr:uncharacterized protein GGS23DRAFT_544657 [Durotheca rogersii]KAI5868248.1 hypothetical protein GGS23DRAFT_544657 [Durotheca rogersii]